MTGGNTDNDNNGSVVGMPGKRTLSNKKKHGHLLILGLATIVIIASVIVLWEVTHGVKRIIPAVVTSQSCSSQSSGSILQQATGDLTSGQMPKLKQVVTQIQQLSNYTQDANCLYIVVAYYDGIGNGGEAQTYLTDFNKVYSANPNISSELTDYESVAVLRSNVASLVTITAQHQQDEQYLPKVTAP